MNFELRFSSRAKTEIKNAFEYYESKQKSLGTVFLNILKSDLDIIIKLPEAFPSKRLPFREVTMNKFPFIIIYEIKKNEIVVYSVFNTALNTNLKFKS